MGKEEQLDQGVDDGQDEEFHHRYDELEARTENFNHVRSNICSFMCDVTRFDIKLDIF